MIFTYIKKQSQDINKIVDEIYPYTGKNIIPKPFFPPRNKAFIHKKTLDYIFSSMKNPSSELFYQKLSMLIKYNQITESDVLYELHKDYKNDRPRRYWLQIMIGDYFQRESLSIVSDKIFTLNDESKLSKDEEILLRNSEKENFYKYFENCLSLSNDIFNISRGFRKQIRTFHHILYTGLTINNINNCKDFNKFTNLLCPKCGALINLASNSLFNYTYLSISMNYMHIFKYITKIQKGGSIQDSPSVIFCNNKECDYERKVSNDFALNSYEPESYHKKYIEK